MRVKQKSNYNIITIHVKTEFNLEKTKIIAMGMLFLFFGITSVLSQLFLPEILELSDLQVINLPEPTITQILYDFWGDIGLISLIVILYSASTFSSEFGTAKNGYFYLSRPISPRTYFMTRFLIRVIGIIIMFTVSSVITVLYATLFYDSLDMKRVFIASLLMALVLGTISSFVIMMTTKFSNAISGVSGILLLFIQYLVGLVESLKWFSPFVLSNIWPSLLIGSVDTIELILHFIVLCLWIGVPCLLGWYYYGIKDLI
ncbi:MAG: hypothetical protein OEY49_02285 [Candidatus Heimdallarchaeota archaeon]|nr:hypothetical protein [Candidatus Heimdallarchaeota archaeon]